MVLQQRKKWRKCDCQIILLGNNLKMSIDRKILFMLI